MKLGLIENLNLSKAYHMFEECIDFCFPLIVEGILFYAEFCGRRDLGIATRFTLSHLEILNLANSVAIILLHTQTQNFGSWYRFNLEIQIFAFPYFRCWIMYRLGSFISSFRSQVQFFSNV